MTARRILSHLARAFASLTAASREAREAEAVARREGSGRGVAPIVGTPGEGHARAAIAHLVEAATLISPSAGVRVAEAARRAFDDAHRRAVARDLDAHGLDEGGAAACAAEGTGGHVVDVVAGGADEEGLHGGQHGTDEPRCACGALATHIETEWSVASGEADFERVVGHRCHACIDEMVLPTRTVAPEEWDALDRAVRKLGDEPWRWRLH